MNSSNDIPVKIDILSILICLIIEISIIIIRWERISRVKENEKTGMKRKNNKRINIRKLEAIK